MQNCKGSSDSSDLSKRVVAIWKHRAEQLKSDFALAGHLLNVQPSICTDAKKDVTPDNLKRLEAVASKLLRCPDHSDNEREQLVQCFMDQFHAFCHKLGWFNNETM